MKKKLTWGKVLIYFCVTITALICVLPLLLVFIVSFTEESEIVRNGYSFFPKELSHKLY